MSAPTGAMSVRGLVVMLISVAVLVSMGLLLFSKFTAEIKGMDFMNSTHADYDKTASDAVNSTNSTLLMCFGFIGLIVLVVMVMSILGVFT